MARRTTVGRVLRWMGRVGLCLLLAVGLPSAGRIALTTPATAAAIAYPDLQMQVPASEIAIGDPTPTTRELRYSHITWNAGAGPLEIRPNYDPSTGIAHPSQALFSASGSGWTFVTTVPIAHTMTYDAAIAKYAFPLAGFGLFSVGEGGSVGSLIRPSPKSEYCMTEDTYLGGVPNTPAQPNYPGSNCGTPTATLGIDVGWGDKYDLTDPGQNIDITGLADGTYWLRAQADPFHYLAQSNTANDITDTEIAIAGDQVTVLQQTHPDSTPPTVALTSPGTGASVGGTVTVAATATGPAAISSVQFLLDGGPLGAPTTGAPYSFAWNTAGVPLGSHVLSAQATDARGFIGTAPAVAVTIATVVGGITQDVSLQQTGIGSTTTPAFSTSSVGELLLAFVGSDGPEGAAQTATISGAGLSWSLVARANGQAGDAEVWQATAPSALFGATITTTPGVDGYDQAITVLALKGASGVGATATANARNGAPSVKLTTRSAGSWALAAGNDWDSATARTVGAGQVLLSQVLDSRTQNTFWAQGTTDPSSASGQPVTVSDTAPTEYRWNLAALEVLPGSPPPPAPPETQPPVVSIANPADGQTVSGTTPVTASATDDVAVASVQLLLDGKPLGAPLTAAPYSLAWDTTKVANGAHQLGATATDTSGNVGTAPVITVAVTNPPPPMACFTVDVNTSVDGRGAVTTAPFRTGAPGELLLAFAESDGLETDRQSVTVSGAGLTWTLVARANEQAGDAEIWKATAPAMLTSAQVTSTPAQGGFDQTLTVIAIQGTKGTGASVTSGAASGPPGVTVTTTAAGSLIFGAGNDWDAAAARTVGPNQALVHQSLATAVGDTYWIQQTTGPAGPAGSAVALGDTAPTGDRWNLAAVEVIGDGS
jgi:hypothetical protein